MKKIVIAIAALAITGQSIAQKLDRSIKPQPGPAPEITLGKSEKFTLPNGLKVFVVENHKLPVISCSIQLDIKPELEGDQSGYLGMMDELLLSGTKKRTKDQLNEEIDQMGATIAPNAQGIYAKGLKKNTDKIFELMSDIMLNSKFTQDELDKQKKKALSELETQKNEPRTMVQNVSSVVNYGTNHPYGEVPNDATINAITLDKCNQYIASYFRPNVAYMAIVGDITVAEIKPIVEKWFAAWEKKDVPAANYPTPTAQGKTTKVAFAPRVGAVQSVVNVTYPVDLKPGTPDVVKARVANTILGGGSQGRLFLNLREKHAWTYGAYSTLKDDIWVGNFSSTVQCRNAVSDSAVEAILAEMKRLQNEPVDDNSLHNAINYISGNFAIGLEDPQRIAQFAINTERYNMPADYYQNYLKNLSAVTAQDVQNMAKKYIDPDHANIVVAGSKETVAGKLASFSADGKVSYYDNYGKPMVISDAKPLPPGVTAESIYKNYITAIGGEKAISAIKDIKSVSKGEVQGIPLTITEMKKAPGKMKVVVTGTMQGKTMTFQKQVFDGTKGYTEAQGQKAEMKGEELDDVKEQADIAADLHPEKYGIKRALKSMDKIDGKDVYVVEATDKNNKSSTEYYEVSTSYLLRKVTATETPQGKVSQISDFKDYAEVPGSNGYKVPYTIGQSGGGFDITAKVEKVEINKNIPDSEFK